MVGVQERNDPRGSLGVHAAQMSYAQACSRSPPRPASAPSAAIALKLDQSVDAILAWWKAATLPPLALATVEIGSASGGRYPACDRIDYCLERVNRSHDIPPWLNEG